MEGQDRLRNFDAWLEAPFQRMCAEQEAEAEAWEAFCAARNGPVTDTVNTILGPRPAPPSTPEVPEEACEPEHPDHAIYQAWLALEAAIGARWDRLQYEDYANDKEQQ
jgi:hypothetical protein